ncbi:MAG: RluA family pseudouridine synthase, partial [Terrimicrobiaceae bacterium]|nr:RluA family pseudouridine synthase [Terrimicrobiaceae bacterium]
LARCTAETSAAPQPPDGDSSREWVVEAESKGTRLDLFLVARLGGVTRSRVQAAIRAGRVACNGRATPASRLLAEGDLVRWEPPPPAAETRALPEPLPLEILHEDESLLVVHKPAGMVVHPGAGNMAGTLVSALLHHRPQLSDTGDPLRPGIVHRLDKETSGLLLVARTDAAHAALAAQFASRTVSKTYLAVTTRPPHPPKGRIEAPIARHPVNRQKMAVAVGGRGKPAITTYRALGRTAAGLWVVACSPLTGRTHQIRVHLKHIGCPVAGDPLYGSRGRHSRRSASRSVFQQRRRHRKLWLPQVALSSSRHRA